MLEVRFYPSDSVHPLTFVVIAAKSGVRQVFCRHRDRTTWEMPGGHIEPGESPAEAAARELVEETGAVDFDLEPVCIYSVVRGPEETFGMLFRAHIHSFSPLTHEIAEIQLTTTPPGPWTYPLIQPKLMERV